MNGKEKGPERRWEPARVLVRIWGVQVSANQPEQEMTKTLKRRIKQITIERNPALRKAWHVWKTDDVLCAV